MSYHLLYHSFGSSVVERNSWLDAAVCTRVMSAPASSAAGGGAASTAGAASPAGAADAATTATSIAGTGSTGIAITTLPNPFPSLSVLPSPSPAQHPLVASTAASSSSSSTAKGVQFSDSRKRRKRHADRVLPERVEIDVPESALFRSLLALERRLDAAIARRYVELQEALYTPQHVSQQLTNTANQH